MAKPITLGFARREAVIIWWLAAFGGVNRPDGSIVPVKQFPTGTHPTAQFTKLLLIPAVVTRNCKVCEVVTLESGGDTVKE